MLQFEGCQHGYCGENSINVSVAVETVAAGLLQEKQCQCQCCSGDSVSMDFIVETVSDWKLQFKQCPHEYRSLVDHKWRACGRGHCRHGSS